MEVEYHLLKCKLYRTIIRARVLLMYRFGYFIQKILIHVCNVQLRIMDFVFYTGVGNIRKPYGDFHFINYNIEL